MHTHLEHFEQVLEPIWARFHRSPEVERAPRPGDPHRRSGLAPARILEDESHIVVECDVAGSGPDDIDIVLSGRVLAISVGRGSPSEQSFTLPRDIDLPGMKAVLQGHQLRVTLPRRDAVRGLGRAWYRKAFRS